MASESERDVSNPTTSQESTAAKRQELEAENERLRASLERIERRARGAADSVKGIPIFSRVWSTFFEIEREAHHAR